MLTFLIVAAVMSAAALIDFPPVARQKQTKVTVIYCILTAFALVILALYIFDVNLPGLYGY